MATRRTARNGDSPPPAASVTRRSHLTILLAAAIGVLTGTAVAGFDRSVEPVTDFVLDRPLWVAATAPALGLLAVALLGRLWRDPDTATTDAYVRAYHERDGRLPLRPMLQKVIGSAVTLGSGNAFGFEGPSILIGGSIGSATEHRFAGRLHRDDAKVLMVAGAAAGVAAVFKAPLTGIVFALEVPYRSDLARRALLPTLVAAGAAYVTYVAFVGTRPLLSTGGTAPFDLKDLGGGVALGLICGLLARAGAAVIGRAKQVRVRLRVRLAVAAVGLIALAPLAHWWFDEPLHLGPSYDAISWALAPDRSVALLAGLFALRAAATLFGVLGGGIGGLFIPLVTQGAIVGAIFQDIVEAPNMRLFPTIAIAAFLGAGYRTPLAGVAFVAEATGQPGFLVPALLAAAAAQLTMGRHSFSSYQRSERLPDLEPLTRLPVREIMSPNVDTVDAALPLDEVVTTMLRQNRRWAPVVHEGEYFGLLAVRDVANVDAEHWPGLTARDVARTDVLPAGPAEPVSAVAERLRASGAGAVAVTGDGRVLGVVTLRDLSNVEVLLDRLNNEAQ